MALSLSDAAVGCQIVELTLNRQLSVELPYLVSMLTTVWARRGWNRSVVTRIPCHQGLEDIHSIGHHMMGILPLFY